MYKETNTNRLTCTNSMQGNIYIPAQMVGICGNNEGRSYPAENFQS
jgi:hypothetical protein